MWISSTDTESGRYFATLLVGYRTYPGGRIENVVFVNGANVAMTSMLLGRNPQIELHLGQGDAIDGVRTWAKNRSVFDLDSINVLEEPAPMSTIGIGEHKDDVDNRKIELAPQPPERCCDPAAADDCECSCHDMKVPDLDPTIPPPHLRWGPDADGNDELKGIE